jgi:hypothetical protein
MRSSTVTSRTWRPRRISDSSDWACPVRRAISRWLTPSRCNSRYTAPTSRAPSAVRASGRSYHGGVPASLTTTITTFLTATGHKVHKHP